LVISVAAVGAVCAATDWPLGGLLGVDWERHSVSAGVLTGALLLAVGYVGVESYIGEREEQRWERVAQVAFKAIGLSASHLREGMDWLLAGQDGHALRDSPLTSRLTVELQRRLELAGPAVVRFDADDHLGRLRVLADDSCWAGLAVEGLDQLKWRHRNDVARWAPLILANDHLAEDFARLADLNELISEVQKPLRRSADIDARTEFDESDPDKVARAIVERWDRAIIQTVLVHEDFMRAAGNKSWTREIARARLSDDARTALDQRDRQEKSGHYAPRPA
jgi:hypothetical protein